MNPKMFLCKSHPDFHVPSDVEVGRNFNAEKMALKLKANNVDAMVFFAKCHYGYSYYPTKIGTVHPMLKKDMLAEVVRAFHKHGMGVICYSSVFLDRNVAAKHPDWCYANKDRENKTACFEFEELKHICVNSPYLDELLIPQSVEIIKNYDVDGIFFDTMATTDPCYCKYCRKLYDNAIPDSKADKRWVEYNQKQYSQFRTFYEKIGREVHKVRSDIPVSFNWMWSEMYCDDPIRDADILVLDTHQKECQSLACSFSSRYFAGTGYPFEVMVGRFLHGLGDWSTRPFDMLRQEMATVAANGGNSFIIDRMLPDGSIDKKAYEALKNAYDIIKEREEYLKDTSHVPEIAVLSSKNTLMGKDLEFFCDLRERLNRLESVQGIFRLLAEHGRHFTILNETNLKKRINSYKLIIIPEQEHLEKGTIDILNAYLEDGGNVIASQIYSEGEVDKSLFSLYGTDFESFYPVSYGYIQDAEDAIIIRGNFAKTRLTTGNIFSNFLEPMGARDRKGNFGLGVAPPSKKSDFPAVVINKYEKGNLIYITAPIFKSYYNYQNPHSARFILKIIDKLFPSPTVKLNAPPQVELVVTRKSNDLIVHLINLSGERKIGNWPLTEYVPELFNLVLKIRNNGKIEKIKSIPLEKKLLFQIKNGYAEINIDCLKIMETIFVKDYFL